MTIAAGIDLGTSGVKVVLSENCAAVLAETSVRLAVDRPQVGWAEQDAGTWVAAVFACFDRLAADVPRHMAAVEAIGLSGQMLSALLLDGQMKPLRPAILWNDQRSAAECAELLRLVPDIGRRTNGVPDPGITAPKLMWIARHEPRVMDAARMLLLTKDYVRLALTGEIASEPTDAGGTQLFDVAGGCWDAQLCAAVGWNPSHLPDIVAPWHAAGTLRPELATRWGVARRAVPVAAGSGDNMGSALGVGGARPGDVVLTIGTSAVSCMVDGAFHAAPDRAVLTSAHAAPETFLSMGVVLSATASVDWTAQITGTDPASLAAGAQVFAETGRLEDAPVFLPALTGIRTPLNRPDASGRIDGLHPGVSRAMLGYATLEGVAFQIADCVEAQIAAGVPADRFAAVGGGTRSAFWVRLIASVIGHPISLPELAPVSGPMGAARLAAVAAGAPVSLLSDPAVQTAVIEPDAALSDRLTARRERYCRLLPAPG